MTQQDPAPSTVLTREQARELLHKFIGHVACTITDTTGNSEEAEAGYYWFNVEEFAEVTRYSVSKSTGSIVGY